MGIISVGVRAQIGSGRHAGSASGVISAAYQVGGAIGLAVVTTLATSKTTTALAHGVA
jgi:hypothetical protein